MRSGVALFLAAETPRSKAYAQAFQTKGIRFSKTVIFDKPGVQQPGNNNIQGNPDVACNVALADLNIPLATSCKAISDEVDEIRAENVSDPHIAAVLEEAAGRGVELVVYSGYGGQLVAPQTLGIGIPFLHAHSGWLPEYRGSTTIYYSLLNGDGCGVSAILLSPGIDEGPVLARKKFPPPPPGVDIDYFYDPAIRADLICEVLTAWTISGRFSRADIQNNESATTYYVVHPAIKHLATMRVNG